MLNNLPTYNPVNNPVFDRFKTNQPSRLYQQNTYDNQASFTIKENKTKKYTIPLILATAFTGAIVLCQIIGKRKLGQTGNSGIKLLYDNEYRAQLAKDINTRIENLTSVIGIEEFKKVLADLKPDAYKNGDNFTANFHIHTTNSDGKLSPQEVLDQAADLASKFINKQDEPAKYMYISITDHDTLEGSKEAIRIIAANPEKYKNIKFIPGIELTTKYENSELLLQPLQLETLGYGINPFNPDLNEFLEVRRQANLDSAAKLLDDIKKLDSQFNFDLNEARSKFKHLKYAGSPGFRDNLDNYVFSNNSSEKYRPEIEKLFIKHFGEAKHLTKSSPNLSEIIEIVRKSGGISAIAHLGKLNLNGRLKPNINGTEATLALINDFKNKNGEAIEYYYQKYKPGNEDWWNQIRESYESKNLSFLKTGSFDTHGLNITQG